MHSGVILVDYIAFQIVICEVRSSRWPLPARMKAALLRTNDGHVNPILAFVLVG